MTTKIAQSQESATLEVDVTVEAAAYAAGDLIGGKLSITVPPWAAGGGAGFLIQSVAVVDQAKQSAALDVLFFNEDPSATTFTENAPLDVADGDMGKIVGFASLSVYTALNDNSFGLIGNLALPCVLAAGGSTLYAAIVSRGAPTFAATTDVKLRIGLVRL